MARTKLSLDWDSLFPGETVEIGTFPLVIKPLSIFALASVAKQLKGFGAILQAEGVTWENYSSPDSLIKLATILLTQFPSVLADAADVEQEDIEKLPLEYVVKILDKVLEVNLKSREDLEKNFKSLAKKFQTVVPKQE